ASPAQPGLVLRRAVLRDGLPQQATTIGPVLVVAVLIRAVGGFPALRAGGSSQATAVAGRVPSPEGCGCAPVQAVGGHGPHWAGRLAGGRAGGAGAGAR